MNCLNEILKAGLLSSAESPVLTNRQKEELVRNFTLLKRCVEVLAIENHCSSRFEGLKLTMNGDAQQLKRLPILLEILNNLNYEDSVNFLETNTEFKELMQHPEIAKILKEKSYDYLSRWLKRYGINETATSVKTITVLDLSNKRIEKLPKEIGNLTSLQELYVSNNKLSSLPESIGNLSSLQELWVSNNKLSSLPESIGNLSSLERLSVSHNKLSSLPESIGNLSSLQTLYLHNNQLSSLPESIENLSSLQYLYLNNNRLKKKDVKRFERSELSIDILT